MSKTPETPVAMLEPPSGYADWLTDLKTRIHTAQQRAALAVNRELVLLYWQIGRDILARQAVRPSRAGGYAHHQGAGMSRSIREHRV